MTIDYVPAAGWPYEDLAATFTAGFEGYIVPVSLNAGAMQTHIEQNDVDLRLSRLALDNGQPVGIVLNAVRGPVCWIGGIGVAASHRRQGIARALMNAAIDASRAAGLDLMELEVIEGNAAATHLYLDLGFNHTHNLLIIERQPASVSSDTVADSITPEQALAAFDSLHTTPVPWQRQPVSLRPLFPRLSARALRRDGESAAYVLGILSADTINILDIAGERGALDTLMRAVHAEFPGARARLVNLGDDDPAWPVLERFGYTVSMRQLAMSLPLK